MAEPQVREWERKSVRAWEPESMRARERERKLNRLNGIVSVSKFFVVISSWSFIKSSQPWLDIFCSFNVDSNYSLKRWFGSLCTCSPPGFNSFSASLWPANLAPAPANIFKKLCPIIKNDNIHFSVFFFGVIRIIIHRRIFWAQRMFHTTISAARIYEMKKYMICKTMSLVAGGRCCLDVILRPWHGKS